MDAIFQLLEMLIPVIGGMVSVWLFAQIKSALKFIDGLDPKIQQVLVVVQSWALAWIGGALNVQLPVNLSLLDLGTTEAVVMSGLAFIFHLAKKK